MAKNFLLLILLGSLLNADAEFMLSYKLCTQNSYVISEQVYISRAMTLSDKPTQKECILPKKNGKISTLKYLQLHKYKLLECFKDKSIFINANSTNLLHKAHSQITIKMEPVRFTVKFNNGFGIISAFK